MVGRGAVETANYKGTHITRHDFVKGNPKFSIWLTAAEILACINLDIHCTTYRL